MGYEEGRHIILRTERAHISDEKSWSLFQAHGWHLFLFLTAHFSLSFYPPVRFSSQYSCSDNLSGVAEAQKSINVMHHFCSLKRTAFAQMTLWGGSEGRDGVVQRAGDTPDKGARGSQFIK